MRKELLEQGQQIVGSGAGFRVPLEPERGLPLDRNALQGAVKQRTMRRLDVLGQTRLFDGKAMILARDHYAPGRKILNRVIGTVVTEFHLLGARTGRECEQLVPQANAENGNLLLEEAFNRFDRVVAGLRITGPIGQEDTVRR